MNQLTHTIDTAVGPLHVVEVGSGPAILLRHGIFYDHTLWDAVVPTLAEHHRVVLIDAPGHGRSGDVPGYRLEHDVEATGQVLDALGIPSAVVVGHSWGGMTGVRFALTHPERVEALVLVDVPLTGPRGLRLTRRLQKWLLGALGPSRFYASNVATAMYSQRDPARYRALREGLVHQFAGADRHSLARAIDAVLIHPGDISAELGRLSMPVVVIAGDEDYVLTPEVRALLARDLPDAPVLTAPGRHVLPEEDPAAVLDAIGRVVAFTR